MRSGNRGGESMTEAAKKAKRAYMRKYYAEHPEALEKKLAYRREWGKKPENKEKIKKNNEAYWLRKAKKMGIE